MIALLSFLFIALVSAKTVRRGDPSEWIERRDVPVDNQQIVRFRLALHQRNMDILKKETLERADPTHANYGKWFTKDQVLDLVAPDQDIVDHVVAWAMSRGLRADGSRRDIVLCEGTVEQVEAALQTRLTHWKHNKSGHTKLRTVEFTLPDDVHQHVELLAGLTEFWTPPQGPKQVAVDVNEDKSLKKRNSVKAGYVIPDTVRRLYKMPKDSFRDVSAKSSVCVAEFQDNARFSHRDLRFFDHQVGEHHSHVDHIVGPWRGFQPNAESQLDIEYASTLALNSSYWYWTATEWMMEFSNDLFARRPGPDVVSMSWGWPEPSQCQIANCKGITSRQYVDRVNKEWLKITTTGVTLTASSGDQGAPGDTYAQTCGGLSTIFPGASEWVLSVGATMLSDSAPHPPHHGKLPPACHQFDCSTVTKEVACSIPEALITTGGGFSDYVAQPKWQAKEVNAYLQSGVQFPPKSSFNSANRAFPDISAMGHAVLIGINDQLTQVDGTSCSSPMVAAMIALLNGWRLNNGKTTLGFVNMMMYNAYRSDPSIFNDITVGNNKCSEGCCSQTFGFETAKGWDAATGLGTPNFEKLLAYVKTL